MPRSSRHKSSKHSSREAREHSDSEKDLSLKERKAKEGSGVVRASKDFGLGEKRKLGSKDGKESHVGSGNGEYTEDYSSSKRRKERSDGRACDRWNGGEDDYYGCGSKKSSKASGDSKSKRRDDVRMYEEREELKKNSSSGKGEARHRDRDLSRKEVRESGCIEKDKEKDRERKSTDGRSERLGSNDDHRGAPKQVVDITDINAQVDVGGPESHNLLERRTRKTRNGSVDVDKYEDDIGDVKGRRLSSRDNSGKDGKLKDETRRDERYKDKHREDMDKQRDERLAKCYHPSNRSDDKQYRDEKDTEEAQQKISKFKDSEHKEENSSEQNRDSELRYREHDRISNRGRNFDHDCDHDHDWDRDQDRHRDRHRGRSREQDREQERDRGHDYDREYEGSQHDDRAVRHKDTSRGKRVSPDCQYGINDSQSRSVQACFSDMENNALTGDRNVLEVSKRRSHSRPAYTDKSSNKWRTSRSSNSHVSLDDNRHINPEDLKYMDSTSEQESKSVTQREVSVPPELSERGSKYTSTEKSTKIDDNLLGEQSIERSSSSKASPLGTKERSSSPPSKDRRYVNRSGVRWSLDIEETGRRSRGDFRTIEERPSRDLQSEKPMDDSSLVDSSVYNRSNRGNSSSFLPPHPGFRSGLDSPSFIGSLEDDGQVNSNGRYCRSSDSNMGRAHVNAWRGVPNWASPVPNGFIPFQHGPPSGGFQGMMPQFPGPLFGVRPSMEINHSGMPYNMGDAERFSSHLRPLGWHMDGSGPSHVHGWDGSNGAFRDEPQVYGTADWDQNRYPLSGHGWEPNPEGWKGQNGETKRDRPSPSHKDDYPVLASEDDVGQAGQLSNYKDGYNQRINGKFTERRLPVASPVKESTFKIINEKTPDHSKSWRNDVSRLSYYYLSKLDISAELVHPEVHNQFMNLLGTQQSETVDDDTSMHIILEDGSRAGLKASNTSWISSHFPLIEGSVFERAMDLYKKQKMETRGSTFLKDGMLDPFLTPNPEDMEEVLDHKVEKVEDQVVTKDAEIIDAPISNKDPKNIESVSSAVAVEKLVEFVSTPTEEQNNINLHPPKLEASIQDHNEEEELGETAPTSCGEKMEEAISSDQVKSGNVDTDGMSSVNTTPPGATPPSATPPSAVGDNLNGISKTNGDHSMSCAEEGMSFADATKRPLCIPDGSPIACEDMISESNESVILSRIHHSPESTH